MKLLSGETRPSQLRTEPQPPELEPEPPAWLSESAREVWDRVIEDLEAARIAFRMDTDVIAAYCSSVALLGEAERALAANGYMRIDDHGESRRNPWLLVRASALDGVAKFGSLLGLSPAARTTWGSRCVRGPRRMIWLGRARLDLLADTSLPQPVSRTALAQNGGLIEKRERVRPDNPKIGG